MNEKLVEFYCDLCAENWSPTWGNEDLPQQILRNVNVEFFLHDMCLLSVRTQ